MGKNKNPMSSAVHKFEIKLIKQLPDIVNLHNFKL